MNWLDLLIIFIITVNIMKNTRLGLVRAIFSILKFLVAIYLTRLYYPKFSRRIIEIPFLYKGFEKLLGGIIKVLFYGKIKENENFLSIIKSGKIADIFISIICIIILYLFVKWVLGFLERFISFIFKAPILKQLNKVGGFLFGLIRGMLIIYMMFAIFIPIQFFYPEGVISKAINSSLFSDYFKTHNLIIDFFNIKNII